MSIHKEGSIPLQRPAAADKPGQAPRFQADGVDPGVSNPGGRRSRGRKAGEW